MTSTTRSTPDSGVSRRGASIVVLAVSLLLAGCGGQEVLPVDESLVTGTVLDAAGDAVAGAEVLIYRLLDSTDEEGSATVKSRLTCDDEGRFRFALDGFGSARLVARAQGTSSEPVLVRPGDTVDLRLPPL